MSEHRMGVEGFHEHWTPEDSKGSISRDEYLEWKSNAERKVKREAERFFTVSDDDEMHQFLLDAGWKWKSSMGASFQEWLDAQGWISDDVGLVPPYYTIIGYRSLREAVELELLSQEFTRFRQNILEERAKNVPTRNS